MSVTERVGRLSIYQLRGFLINSEGCVACFMVFALLMATGLLWNALSDPFVMSSASWVTLSGLQWGWGQVGKVDLRNGWKPLPDNCIPLKSNALASIFGTLLLNLMTIHKVTSSFWMLFDLGLWYTQNHRLFSLLDWNNADSGNQASKFTDELNGQNLIGTGSQNDVPMYKLLMHYLHLKSMVANQLDAKQCPIFPIFYN